MLAARASRARARSADDQPGVATLEQAFDPRHNSLAMCRLGLAAVVAVTHAWVNAFEHQPRVGSTDLSAFAVDGFFVLSGFLVTRSYVRLRSLARYTWHRFLRIMPGFWLCLTITAFVVAPLAATLAGRSAGSVLTGEDPAWSYLTHNASLVLVQQGIAGLWAPGVGDVFNGSLWTLQYEAACYGVVGLLGAVGALRRPRWVVLVLAVATWAALVADHVWSLPDPVPGFATNEGLRFVLVFLLGSAAHLYADRLPVHRGIAAGSGLVVLGAAFLPDYRVVAAGCFAYLCVYAMVRLPLRWTPRWDLSYGLYVYHWPVQFLFVLLGATALGPWPFVAVTTVVALAAAAGSWCVVEGPALRLKDVRPAVLTRHRRRSSASPA